MKRGTTGTFVLILMLIAASLASCAKTQVATADRIVFTISHDYGYDSDPVPVFLDMEEMENLFGTRDLSGRELLDLRNNESVYFRYMDSDSDREADFLVFTFQPDRKEPLRAFAFATGVVEHEIQMIDGAMAENILEINYLFPPDEDACERAGGWSGLVAGTFMEHYPDACGMEIFAPGKWTYTNGFFNNALCEMHRRTGNPDYLEYVRKWMDCFVDEKGDIRDYVQEKYRLDDILPGRSLLFLLEQDPVPRYKVAADLLIHHLENQPRTSEGGYWHKEIYAHQMWLDGIYMGDVFTAQYAQQFGIDSLYAEAARQVKLIFKHTYDPESGLMYHGWDESVNDIWSDPLTGASPEFWGRGLGWFMMALVDILDYLPADLPERKEVIEILHKVSAGVSSYQSKSSGLWYQVLDKGEHSDNWIETSCSAMFAYAFAKGARKGYLEPVYWDLAEKAFQGLIQNYVYIDSNRKFYLTGTVKVGTLNFNNSDGSYNYYVGVDRRVNDFKGVSAFLYLAMEMDNI